MGLFQWGAQKWWLSLSLCIEVDSLQKWLTVKNRITEEHGIQVCFSAKLNSYLSACRYVYKNGQGVAHSENHPPALLTVTSPRTKKSTAGFRAGCSAKRKSTEKDFSRGFSKKRKRFAKLDLSECIWETGINSYTELLAVAVEWRTAAQMDIA